AGLCAAAQAAKRPPTLGLLHETIALAIAYGAPTYNAGDHAGCGNFYAEAAATLATACAGSPRAGLFATQGLADLADARERFAGEDDVDRRAWTMRLAFDLINLAWESEAARGAGLTAIGQQYLQRGNYAEAEAALARADEIRDDLRGSQASGLAVELRLAPLFAAQALLPQGRYADAAEILARGLDQLPELATVDFDLRSLYANSADLRAAIDDLAAVAAQADTAVDTLVLLAIEYHFTGERARATTLIARARQRAPDHPGVRLFAAVAVAPAAPAAAAPTDGEPAIP
ncbi:MAG: hypothetical protein H0W72_18225, partial [Planctomycetes bacterium]|nr:hypothetical protein [Planctomycetota bacterium]